MLCQLSYAPVADIPFATNGGKEELFPLDLVDRMFAFSLAVLGSLDLRQSTHDVDRRAVVEVVTFLALKPNPLTFCCFGHRLLRPDYLPATLL